MKNLGNMMKQAQAMQAKMAEAQAKLEQMTVEGASGGGMVKVVLSGKGEMKGLTIDQTTGHTRGGSHSNSLTLIPQTIHNGFG